MFGSWAFLAGVVDLDDLLAPPSRIWCDAAARQCRSGGGDVMVVCSRGRGGCGGALDLASRLRTTPNACRGPFSTHIVVAFGL
eukprot:4070922-Amphidinium_carterae.2